MTFTEGDFLRAADDGGDALVTDADSANFDGGTLTVSIIAGGVPAQDQIGVVGGAIVQTTGGNITITAAASGTGFDVVIGTFTGGTNGNPYVITFNAEATPDRVSLVLPLIGYRNASGDNPTPGDRTLEFTITDGDGGSDTATSTVQVVAVNNIPKLDLNGTGPANPGIDVNAAYVEDDVPTVLAPNARLTDPDSDIVSVAVGFTSGFVAGEDELTIGGATSGTLGSISWLFNSATGAMALTGAASPSEYQALVRQIAFSSTSNEPGTARTISFIVQDGTDPSLIAYANVAITPVNDAPNFTIGPDFTILEDAGPQSVTSYVTGIDPVEAGQTASVTSVTNDNNALFSVQPSVDASGTLTYTPAANANGSALVTIEVMDDGGTANGGNDTTSLSFFINVTPVSDAPSGADKVVATSEDTSYTFTLADFGFSDPDDSPADDFINVRIASVPAAGSLTLNGAPVAPGLFLTVAQITAGQLKFVPAANANGVPYASFTFQVIDDGGTANGGADIDPTPNTITVNVAPVADAPVAPATNSVTTNEDTPSLAVPIGASDPDNDIVSYTLKPGSGPVGGGTVSFAGGSFVFTPAGNQNGADSFTILIEDSTGNVIEQVVDVTIVPLPDLPIAVDDSVAAAGAGQVTSIPVAVLLANDFDLDGDAISLVSVGNATGGTVSLTGSTVSFTPTPGFVGTGGFDYTITTVDGGDSAHVTVTGVVGGSGGGDNTPPVIAPAGPFKAIAGTGAAIAITASDLDGDVLSFGADDPANGDIAGGTGGVFVYTPDPGFTGTETVTVTVSDGRGGTATRDVSVEVIALPDTIDWTIEAATGHVSEIGGTGLYVGTPGFQQVTVLDQPGLISFDSSIAQASFAALFIPPGTQTYGPVPGGTGSTVVGTNAAERITLAGDANATLEASFVRGNDTAAILGLSSSYAVSASVAGVSITSAAGAHIRIPAFDADGGLTLEFSDVTLELTTTDGETFALGTQTITGAPLMIGTGLPPVGASNGALIYRGGDLVVLAGDADQWCIVELDGTALLTDGDTHVEIPLGTTGVLVAFDDGPRTMALDPHTQAYMIGTQVLSDVLVAVSAPAQAFGPWRGTSGFDRPRSAARAGRVNRSLKMAWRIFRSSGVRHGPSRARPEVSCCGTRK